MILKILRFTFGLILVDFFFFFLLDKLIQSFKCIFTELCILFSWYPFFRSLPQVRLKTYFDFETHWTTDVVLPQTLRRGIYVKEFLQIFPASFQFVQMCGAYNTPTFSSEFFAVLFLCLFIVNLLSLVSFHGVRDYVASII